MYTVLRDQQEKKNFWDFQTSSLCTGTEVVKLPTGDYTLRGYESVLTIERKANTGEFAKNIVEARFERELVRMELFKYSFIILEFTLADIMNFPHGSRIPPSVWRKLKINSHYLLRRLVEFEIQYSTKIILADQHGKKVASSIFKRVIENEQRQIKETTSRTTAIARSI